MSTKKVSILIAQVGAAALATAAIANEQIEEAAACYLCSQAPPSYFCWPAANGYAACRDVTGPDGITVCQLSGPNCIVT